MVLVHVVARAILRSGKNRGAMSRHVRAGREPGLLAYESGRPVGWISVAPRSDFKQLDRSPTLKPQDPEAEGIYSIVCFYVHPTARRRGGAEALLRAAVDHVRVLGGKIVEAYPSEQMKTTMEFMGESKLFLRNGFEVVRKARSRLVMRYIIGQRERAVPNAPTVENRANDGGVRRRLGST